VTVRAGTAYRHLFEEKKKFQRPMTIASDALIRYIKKHEEYSFERIAGWYCSDRPVIT